MALWPSVPPVECLGPWFWKGNKLENQEKMFRLSLADDKIAILTIDMPNERVNKLNSAYLGEIEQVFKELEKKEVLGMVLISGKPDNFIVGADIHELKRLKNSTEITELSKAGQDIFNRFSELPFPTVAAIHGSCLGGGYELALACTYRLLSPDESSVVGLPEVQVGLLPGAGGTQRLPRLIGLVPALDLILTGSKVRPSKALKLGMVDELVHQNLLLSRAKEVLPRLADRSLEPKRPCLSLLQRFLGNTNLGRALLKSQAQKGILKKTGGKYPAPLKAMESAIDGFSYDFLKDGLALEARLFGEVGNTEVAKNLMGLFESMTATKKNFDKSKAKNRYHRRNPRRRSYGRRHRCRQPQQRLTRTPSKIKTITLSVAPTTTSPNSSKIKLKNDISNPTKGK
jgi:3-hydroxyacyl-CoA dehydrogenase/enoyl-CoA hydratase/3-hydroxybutyryl-CoA epimerase